MVPDDTNIDFVRRRHAAFTITTLLTVAAIALVLVRGLNMGADFVGGLMIAEKFESPPPLDEVRQTIESLDVGEATLQQFGDPHTISIRLPAHETTAAGATNAIVNKVETELSAKFPRATFSPSATVSATFSCD